MILIDTWCRQHSTIGFITYDNWTACTLELPWRNNQVNKSCIADGIYPYERIYSENAKTEVLRLKGVENRTLINIEPANFVEQSLGCIFVGASFQFINHDNLIDVASSRPTLETLLSIVPSVGRVMIRRCGLYSRIV